LISRRIRWRSRWRVSTMTTIPVTCEKDA